MAATNGAIGAMDPKNSAAKILKMENVSLPYELFPGNTNKISFRQKSETP